MNENIELKMSNYKAQMSNPPASPESRRAGRWRAGQTQMLQCQSLPVWHLDFDIHLSFGALVFDILKIHC